LVRTIAFILVKSIFTVLYCQFGVQLTSYPFCSKKINAKDTEQMPKPKWEVGNF
jgi:hypothetical protein